MSRISPNRLSPPSAGIRTTDPVATCECGGALYVQPCRDQGEVMRFHCRECGYCGTYARRKFATTMPEFHRVLRGAG